MPRYNYECRSCGKVVIIFHGIEEAYTDCGICEQKNTMKKLLSVPFINKVQVTNEHGSKVGDLTKEYIKMNKEVLKQQKEEIKKENHEPS